MIKDYVIVGCDTTFGLEKMVLQKISEGYELLGGIAIQGKLFAQAMIKKEV